MIENLGFCWFFIYVCLRLEIVLVDIYCVSEKKLTEYNKLKKNTIMKNLIIAIIFLLSINLVAQDVIKTNIFIRIYDLQGNKINKGKIKTISKTSIELYLKGKEIIKIPLKEIGIIKTKRSGGHNIVKGTLIGGGSLAIIGLLGGNSNSGYVSVSATDKAALGLIGGSFFGAIVGGITTIFKKSKLYIINGNEIKLSDFKNEISNLFEK